MRFARNVSAHWFNRIQGEGSEFRGLGFRFCGFSVLVSRFGVRD